ncbi:MAG: ATP-binding protein [Myxococcota bacterium]
MSEDYGRALPHQRQVWSVTVGQWLGVLVAVLFAGPLFLSNLWGYLETRRYLSELTAKTARNIASAEAGRVQAFIQEAEALAPALERGTPELGSLLEEASGGDSDRAAAARAKVHGLLRVVGATVDDLGEIQILSPGGLVLASSRSPEPTPPSIVSAICVQRARASSSVAAFEPGDGTHELLVAATLESGQLFCARFEKTVFPRLLAGLESEPERGDRYLVDERRAPIAAALHGPERVADGWMQDLLRAASDEPWSRSFTDAEGQALSIAYQPLKRPAWGVVVSIPATTNLAELEGLKRQAMIVFLSLTAVVALAMFMAWRTLVGPLRALASTAERIAGGAIGATVPPAGPREVVELSATFNRMSLALRESQQTLEQKIEERTRELRESEEFLEHLLNSIDQRVVVTDRDFRIQKANNAADRMHGQSLLGSRCYEIFEGRTSPCDQCPVAETFRTGAGATAEQSQQTARGRELFAIETYPVRGAQGNVDSVIAISRVISDEKQLQAKLAFQEKMAAFGQLAAGVAHELGNPLASIDAQLQRAEGDPARATTSLPIVRKEVGRMSRMLRELVDFARRKRGDVRLAMVNQVVEDVIRLLEHDPRARNIELVRELAPELPGIRLVEDHLVQVLLNLGLNALDALPQGGKLIFATTAVAGSVELRVRDTGTGIPAETMARLFEAFHTTKAAGRGTGLGLFVSRRIVEGLGGQLLLERTGPEGTCFVVRLPVGGASTEVA